MRPLRLFGPVGEFSMAKARPEPFEIALATLRRRLREGILPPGQRITAVEVADDLKLSTTPVRATASTSAKTRGST